MRDIVSRLGDALHSELFRIGDTVVTGSTLITLVLIVLLSFLASRWLRRLTQRVLARRNPGAASTVSALIHYVILVIGFSIALSTAGINLTALFAAGAIFAVGLGFALQSIVQNFVSGVILLTERSIKPGDVLKVEDKIVRVREMGVRASLVQTRDGEDIIIPNSVLSQNSVVNFTMTDAWYRARVSVGVTYGSDMKLVRATLAEVAAEVSAEWKADREPQIVMTGFGDNSVNWDVGVWMKEPWEMRPALSRLYDAIWWAFHARGIVIAFPQLDVHFDPPIMDTMQTIKQRGAL